MITTVKKSSTKAHNTKIKYSSDLKKGVSNLPSLKGLKSYAWVHFLDDPIFNDYLFCKFAGTLTRNGKKDKIFKILYSLFGISQKKRIPYFLFFEMIERLKPGMICVPIKRKELNTSGVLENVRVPMPTTEVRAYRIAVQYLFKAVKARSSDRSLEERIFNEFEAFFKQPGYVNPFWSVNNELAKKNSFLRHYRRFGIYR